MPINKQAQVSVISHFTLFFLLFLFLGLGAYIFAGFLMPFLLAMIFVVTTYPLFKRLLKLLKGHRISAAFLFCFISLTIFVGIIVLISWMVLGEFFSIKDAAYDKLVAETENWFNPDDWNRFISENTEKVEKLGKVIPFINEETVTGIMESGLQEVSVLVKTISTGMVNALTSGLGKIGGFLIGLLYFYLAAFLFLIDGERMLDRLLYLVPIKNKHIEEIEGRFSSLFKSWIVGNIGIMIVQGVLGGIGLAIAGIPSPSVWAVVMTVTSLVPFIGTAIIWVPAAVFLLIAGHFVSGVFLLIWGAAIVGSSDNFIRPMILKGGAHLPLLILFFALLGGFQALGLRGLLLGPIIVVFLDTIIHIYALEWKSTLKAMNK